MILGMPDVILFICIRIIGGAQYHLLNRFDGSKFNCRGFIAFGPAGNALM
jgi:hypothetical protein